MHTQKSLGFSVEQKPICDANDLRQAEGGAVAHLGLSRSESAAVTSAKHVR